MNADFFNALDLLEREKGIPKEFLLLTSILFLLELYGHFINIFFPRYIRL